MVLETGLWGATMLWERTTGKVQVREDNIHWEGWRERIVSDNKNKDTGAKEEESKVED